VHWLKGGKGFAYPDYKPRWQPDPPFTVEHVSATVTVDLEHRSISGTSAITLQVARPADTIVLHAADMEIQSVKLDGKSAEYSYDGSTIKIRLPEHRPGSTARIEVEYRATPTRGVWFVPIDSDAPARAAWTQGEAEDNRYWLPGYDYPDRKATLELAIRAPTGLFVDANGLLVDKRELGGLTEWRFRLDERIPLYLAAFVVGDFEVYEDEWRGVKLRYIVPRGRGGLVERSFSKTPRIMEFFSNYLSTPFPYPKYDQVAVEEFIFGGMENASITILTDLTLHDETAHREYRSEPLVAHEMAHQWFGDLVTCKDWSHIWLNEGFATLLEALWAREDLGEEEFQHNLYRKLQTYLSEASRYTRPIVERRYRHPQELFDAHSYPKAALVLWTIANTVGEENFRKALRLYLAEKRGQSADTEDLKRSLEEASHMDLDRLFDEYVYSAGHPVIEYSYKWDDKSKTLTVTARQTQGDDQPKPFHIEVELLAVGEGYTETAKLRFDAETAVAALHLPSKPLAACLDPHFRVLAQLKPKLPPGELASALKHCPTLYAKEVALTALAESKGATAAKAAAELLSTAGHWGLRADAARALARIHGPTAKKALLDALKSEKDARVRTAIAEALGSFPDDEAVWNALTEILHNPQEGYFTRAAAVVSLARTKYPRAAEEARKALSYPSHADAIARSALKALAIAAGDEARSTLEEYTSPAHSYLLRAAATAALGYLKPDQKLLDRLAQLARSRHPRVKGAVISAASTLLDERLLPVLQELQRDPETYRAARDTAERIRKHAEKGEEYRKLREEIEKLRAESRELYEKVEIMEKRLP